MKRHALLAALCLGAAGSLFAQTATVDGVGGQSTGDPIFPLSYATINAALNDVRTSETASGTTILVTAAGGTTETAGLNLNVNYDLTIDSTVSGGAHIRIIPSEIAIAGAAAAMVANINDNTTVTLKNLIITPAAGTVGPVNARGIQVYGRSASPTLGTTYVFNCENVWFTAQRVSDNSPVLNPLVHAASADTNTARNAELSNFNGGGANNYMEIRFVGAAESNSQMTVNLKNTVITHVLLSGTAAKGGGIAVSRSRNITLNVNEGCVISYCSGSGIRGVGTLQSGTTFFNVNGTYSNPVIFMKNGWMEDSANTARNEHIQNDGSALSINHAFFVGSYQEAIDKIGLGPVTIQNTIIAEGQTDLVPSSGTPPDSALAPNLKLSGSGNITLENVTIYDNLAPNNDRALNWTAPGTATLSATNVIFAGPGDQIVLSNATAATYNEDNCAIVQAGPDSLESPYITIGTGITTNISDRVTADPAFKSTTFAPTWQGLGTRPGNLTDYLNVATSAYRATRGGTNPINVTGGNPDSELPVSVSAFSVE